MHGDRVAAGMSIEVPGQAGRAVVEPCKSQGFRQACSEIRSQFFNDVGHAIRLKVLLSEIIQYFVRNKQAKNQSSSAAEYLIVVFNKPINPSPGESAINFIALKIIYFFRNYLTRFNMKLTKLANHCYFHE